MSKRTRAPVRASKQPPRPIRITHSFPEPRPDDGDRFTELIRMLLRLGTEKK